MHGSHPDMALSHTISFPAASEDLLPRLISSLASSSLNSPLLVCTFAAQVGTALYAAPEVVQSPINKTPYDAE